MHFLHVVGARPNFMKAAPVWHALALRDVRQTLVHTGQHYDTRMSEVFFGELDLPAPDENLGVGSGTHAQQTAAIMLGLEIALQKHRPALIIVYGDVNSTAAAAMVAVKMGIPIAHVEAGLRSFDRSMPEEINRLITDQLADFLFTPSSDGNENLLREGIPSSRIYLVGNVMIDTLIKLLPRAVNEVSAQLPKRFLLVTLHRPGNVDDSPWLGAIMKLLNDVSKEIPVIFPVHPRTREKIRELGISEHSKVRFLEPVPYLEMLGLQRHATLVLTDSGGVQEETTFLGVPCLTLRENTERPLTITVGTNVLVGRDPSRIRRAIEDVLRSTSRKVLAPPPLWDGQASSRIAEILCRVMS